MTLKIGTMPISSVLEKRYKFLGHISQEKGHEYYYFARFLAGAYELTWNINLHTSKDDVRVCSLKNDYYEQYKSAQRLTTVNIKRFLSIELTLQVTGDWDRHGYGRVRRPYVYGIRKKSKSDTAKANWE